MFQKNAAEEYLYSELNETKIHINDFPTLLDEHVQSTGWPYVWRIMSYRCFFSHLCGIKEINGQYWHDLGLFYCDHKITVLNIQMKSVPSVKRTTILGKNEYKIQFKYILSTF